MRSTRSEYALFAYWYWCLFIVHKRLLFQKDVHVKQSYNFLLRIYSLLLCNTVQGRVVGIATLYRMNNSGIVSRWGRDFPRPFRPDLGLILPLIKGVPFHSRGVRRSGRVIKHPAQSSAEVKGRVKRNNYSSFVSSWQVRDLKLTFYIMHQFPPFMPFLNNQYKSVTVSRGKMRYIAHIESQK